MTDPKDSEKTVDEIQQVRQRFRMEYQALGEPWVPSDDEWIPPTNHY